MFYNCILISSEMLDFNYAECAYDTDKLIYEFLGEFLEVPYDKNGVEIKEGQEVWWTDPEAKKVTIYKVFGNPTSEMVKLWSEFGECEALPRKCEVKVNTHTLTHEMEN